MSKTIKGDFHAKLSSQEGYDILLQRNDIQCLKDPAGNEIRAFALLVDGMVYTSGPPLMQSGLSILALALSPTQYALGPKKLENPTDWHKFLAAIPNPKGKEERRKPSPIDNLRWVSADRKEVYAEILSVWYHNYSGRSGHRPAIASISAPPGSGKTHAASVMAGSGQVFVTDFSRNSSWQEDPEYSLALEHLHSFLGSEKHWPGFQAHLKKAVGVTVSFYYLSEVSFEENIETELSQMIGSRLIYSYFTRGHSYEAWDQFRKFLRDNEYFPVLTAEVALKMIRDDIGAETPLIIVIDELMRLTRVNWTVEWTHSQLDNILGWIRPAYQSKNNYLLLTSLKQSMLNMDTRSRSQILGPRLPSLTLKGVWDLLGQRNDFPQTFLDSPDFMSLIHESAGVPRIVEKTIVQFKSNTSFNLQEQRQQIFNLLSVGQLADFDKRKQAIILSMRNPRYYSSDQYYSQSSVTQLVDEGYMYPLYSEPTTTLKTTTKFGVPPLFIMLWAHEESRSRMPLLLAARGFVEHAKFIPASDPQKSAGVFGEWQVAYLFLLRLWAGFHETNAPTVWDLFQIDPPPGARSFRLVQPEEFVAPQQFDDICDQWDVPPDYGGPALLPKGDNSNNNDVGYDVMFPIECQDVGVIHVATEVTLPSKDRTPQEIAAKFERSFYVFDQATQRTGIKMSLFQRFSEGKMVFFYLGVPEKKATLDKCMQAWQKVKDIKKQIEGQKAECGGDGAQSKEGKEDRSLVERSVVHLPPNHYETLVPASLRFFVPAHRDAAAQCRKPFPVRSFSTRRPPVHPNARAKTMASAFVRFLKR